MRTFITAYILIALSLSLVTCQAPIATPCPDTTSSSARSACSCTGEVIDCSERGLTQVPIFKSDTHFVELRLHNNAIENITDGNFRNLHQLRRLFLENNSISYVSDNAFIGVENVLLRLDLSSNLLETFPAAVGTLDKIDWIDVSNNKIDQESFDEDTMRKIGDTLTRLEFGSPEVESWPETLRHLQTLEFLNVTGGSYYTLPPNAFHGFEGTLTTLSIQHTNLIALPLALASLRYLDTLYFDHNHAIGDAGILIPSFGGVPLLENLKFISLVDDNLRTFPSIMQFLRNVVTLVLDSNRLAFVSDSSVQVAVGTKISNISLANCSLSRVPGALSKLTNLTSLNLAQNNIHSFENSDFDNMGKLGALTVSKNPLEYIANETFKDLQSLSILDLSDTNINTIPEAIRFLKNLHELKLPKDAIECTCNIVWLKQFMDNCNNGLLIDGSCETIESTIRNYLDNHVNGTCPNYNQKTTCV